MFDSSSQLCLENFEDLISHPTSWGDINSLKVFMENVQRSATLSGQHGPSSTSASLHLGLIENDCLVNTDTKSFESVSSSDGSSIAKFTSHELTIVLLGAAAGNCLEWFNFSLFGLMADIFGTWTVICALLQLVHLYAP